MANKIWMKHDLTGKVEQYPAHYKNHPVLSKYLTPSDPYGCTTCGGNKSKDKPAEEAPVEEIPVTYGFDDNETVEY